MVSFRHRKSLKVDLNEQQLLTFKITEVKATSENPYIKPTIETRKPEPKKEPKKVVKKCIWPFFQVFLLHRPIVVAMRSVQGVGPSLTGHARNTKLLS